MNLIYLLTVYSIYSIIVICRQIRETHRVEMEKIKEGYRPIGDSTYILYIVNIVFKLLMCVAIGLLWGYLAIPVTNYWVFILYVAVIFFLLEWSSAFVQAVVITVLRRIATRRQKQELDKKADTLNKQLIEKQRSENK